MMKSGLIATAALTAIALGSAGLGTTQAGSLDTSGWHASHCGANPGAAPEISSKNANAYNKSIKALQAWQDASKTYTNCLVAEGKADQQAIVSTMNAKMSGFNEDSKELSAESNAALQKVNGGNGRSRRRGALGAAAAHDL